MKIIGLIGDKRCGKDYIASKIKFHLSGSISLAFADSLKSCIYPVIIDELKSQIPEIDYNFCEKMKNNPTDNYIVDEQENKISDMREILQIVGTEFVQECRGYKDFWVNIMRSKIVRLSGGDLFHQYKTYKFQGYERELFDLLFSKAKEEGARYFKIGNEKYLINLGKICEGIVQKLSKIELEEYENAMKILEQSPKYVIVTDIRFKQEFEMLKDEFVTKMFFLHRYEGEDKSYDQIVKEVSQECKKYDEYEHRSETEKENFKKASIPIANVIGSDDGVHAIISYMR